MDEKETGPVLHHKIQPIGPKKFWALGLKVTVRNELMIASLQQYQKLNLIAERLDVADGRVLV